MSVLIKGMEMPNNCGECFLYGLESAGNGMYWDYCRGMRQIIDNPDDGRDSYCPLVPVPPHGDLIDRKTAYDSLLNGMVMTGYQSRALDCISDFYVPTIIPAEAEEQEVDDGE